MSQNVIQEEMLSHSRHQTGEPNISISNVRVRYVDYARFLEARQEYLVQLASLYRQLKTQSELDFLKALTENGQCSLRLLLVYVFTLWYTSIFQVHLQVAKFSVYDIARARCAIEDLEKHFSFDQILNISVRERSDKNNEICEYDDRNYKKLAVMYNYSYEAIMKAIEKEKIHPRRIPCKTFIVEKTKPPSMFESDVSPRYSFKEEYGIFCKSELWYHPDYFTRILVSFPIGLAADMYGRKPAFVGSSLVCALSFIIILLPSKHCLYIGNLLFGFGAISYNILYITVLEKCSDTTLLWMGLFMFLVHPFTNIVALFLHYGIRHWRYMHLANTCMLIVLPFGIWYLAESPRWLMFGGNKAKAWEALEDYGAATEEPHTSNQPTSTVTIPSAKAKLKFFWQPVYRTRSITCTLVYFLMELTIGFHRRMGYTLRRGSIEFYLFSSSFEICISPLCYTAAIKRGRGITLFVIYLVMSVLAVVIFTASPGAEGVVAEIILPLLFYCHMATAKTMASILMFYTVEMYPTPYRATALGFCLSFHAIGRLVRGEIKESLTGAVPTTLFMPALVASITCALLTSFLPITRNTGLPDTPREALYMKIFNPT